MARVCVLCSADGCGAGLQISTLRALCFEGIKILGEGEER